MTTKGRRLLLLSALTTTHVGRNVAIGGLVGRLDGIRPVADRIALTLNVGGATVYTSAFPADEAVEVWRAAT